VTRDLDVALLRDTVARLIVEANYNIPADILDALRAAIGREESPHGRRTLEQLVRNYEVAAAERVPVCQDSGRRRRLPRVRTGRALDSAARFTRRFTPGFVRARRAAICGDR
jgi:tartrate dehydratase alpha subunit/fumarate hydratase class I-like protein